MPLQLYSRLRELIAVEDIVGDTLLSPVATIGDFSKFSRLLLSTAYSSGDLGLFEAAARCVAAAVPSESTAAAVLRYSKVSDVPCETSNPS